MTLEALLTLLETGVSQVSKVQATDGAASRRYPKQGAEVSGVSGQAIPSLPNTLDTSPKSQRYQPEALLHRGCTHDTPETPMTDYEHCALVSMGLRWQYSAEDWAQLWNDCQDPAQRANWLRIAESEQPPMSAQEDADRTIAIRIEGSFGSGRKQFDMRVPLDRWDEAAFAEQIAAIPGARWWRLNTPKRCSDCRHAQPTQHPALIDCDQRDDAPSCGYWWSTDEKLCLEWAPSHTDTHGQTASNEQE